MASGAANEREMKLLECPHFHDRKKTHWVDHETIPLQPVSTITGVAELTVGRSLYQANENG